ncbi:MAG: hypothetical protein MZW92_10430 [Comamonadaceae bacterium]|nr:hypothetical protein [Comamonadaceae bacterium]
MAERAPAEIAGPAGRRGRSCRRAPRTSWPTGSSDDGSAAETRTETGSAPEGIRLPGAGPSSRSRTAATTRCAFCVIPSRPGPEPRASAGARSRRRVRDLAGRGYREIVLAGIHLSSYGRDLEPRTSLWALLDALEAAARARPAAAELARPAPDGRPRSSPSSPRAGRIRPHFHLSLQHAADRDPAGDGPAGRRRASTRPCSAELARLVPEAALGRRLHRRFPGRDRGGFRGAARPSSKRSPLTYAHVFSVFAAAGDAGRGAAGRFPRQSSRSGPGRSGGCRRARTCASGSGSGRPDARGRGHRPDGARRPEVLTANAIAVLRPRMRRPERETGPGRDPAVRAGPDGRGDRPHEEDPHPARRRGPEDRRRRGHRAAGLRRQGAGRELPRCRGDRRSRVELVDGGKSARSRSGTTAAGMGREDAALCFRRHSTSKIAREEDLERDRDARLPGRGPGLASPPSPG